MTGDPSIISYLLGPNGGLFSWGIGIGSAGGYLFSQRTAYRDLKRQHDECRSDISELKVKVSELEDRERAGLLASLAQARESAERMTGRIEGGRLKPMDEL